MATARQVEEAPSWITVEADTLPMCGTHSRRWLVKFAPVAET